MILPPPLGIIRAAAAWLQKKTPFCIDVDDPGEVFGCDVEGRLVHIHPRVVDQDVESAQVRLGSGHHRLHRLHVGDIDGQKRRRCAPSP